MDLRDAIAEQSAFSLRLAGRVAPKHAASSNLAFSPLSLHVALSLLAAGSAGGTLQQLVSFLRPPAAAGSSSAAESLNSLASQVVELVLADGSPVGGPRMSFAGGVWVDQSLHLKPAFKQLAASAFKAEARAADFQSKVIYFGGRLGGGDVISDEFLIGKVVCFLRTPMGSPLFSNFIQGFLGFVKAAEVTGEVNSWAESATGGLIRELLPAGSVDHTTRLLLANALYFKGAWSEKFDASKTKESAFHLLDGSSVRAPFMTSKKQQFVRANDGFKSLKLPYLQGDDRRQFSMYLFLPDAKDGIWDLAEKLASEAGNLDWYLPGRKAGVGEFRIPKFKISFGFEASGVMKEMGLVLPFSGGELTEMVDSALGKQLYVSGIFHKSFVEVNEEGTEAAAASAAVVGLRSLPPPPTDFVADHPFIFLIREDLTGVILFIGHVINPLLSG
ncbi:hypothetical protein Taro_019820 [Colocasia esculenta]|uniref:Serpin domain-containing protein n=1 Tax=Colocasia esculenta TaxID=4460 RepID=A0A843V0F5_COLES|nr:hypothetical protein [Colocasia esculenta]